MDGNSQLDITTPEYAVSWTNGMFSKEECIYFEYLHCIHFDQKVVGKDRVILNHFVHLALIEGIFVYQSGVQILDRDQLCIRIHLVPLTDTVQCCIDMSMQIFTLAEMLI